MTPQQNDVLECKHRHLLDVARALRFQANLPISFWGECILIVAFLINKLPTPILKYKSPHQVLLGTVPSYSSLRVFECLCFAKNMNIQHKFDERVKPSIFVGYPYGQKGYRIYDFKTHQIYVSRDVIFHESIFPYHDLPSPSSKNSITITPINDDGTFDYTTPSIVPIDVSSSDSIPHIPVDYSNDSPMTIPTSS